MTGKVAVLGLGLDDELEEPGFPTFKCSCNLVCLSLPFPLTVALKVGEISPEPEYDGISIRSLETETGEGKGFKKLIIRVGEKGSGSGEAEADKEFEDNAGDNNEDFFDLEVDLL